MFKKGWLRRGRISSDEGFSVGIADRSSLIYREGSKKMTIGGELLVNGFVVNAVTIGPWDDASPVDEETKTRIADNVKRALEWNGMSVDFD